MKKQKKPPIKAIYAGRVLDGEKAYLQKFICNGKDRFFKGIRGVYIGYTYLCYAKAMPQRPERTSDEKVENPSWEAADELVDAMLTKRRNEAKIRNRLQQSNGKQVKAVMEALQPLMNGLNYLEVTQLVRHLASKASDQYFNRAMKRARSSK